MVESHVITIRLDAETMQRIEEKRGFQAKSEFYRKIIEDYLDKPVINVNTDEQEAELKRIQAELDHEKAISKVYSERIQDMQKSLGWMQLEYQKLSDRLLLTASSTEKPWWKFWKK